MEDDKPAPKIFDDSPLRLRDAAKIAFPYGGMTESGLRREIEKGHLEVEVIAGKQFVTLRGIREMRERCRAIPGKGRGKDAVVGLTLREESEARTMPSPRTALGTNRKRSAKLKHPNI